MICSNPNCGKEIEKDAIFCGHCGHKIELNIEHKNQKNAEINEVTRREGFVVNADHSNLGEEIIDKSPTVFKNKNSDLVKNSNSREKSKSYFTTIIISFLILIIISSGIFIWHLLSNNNIDNKDNDLTELNNIEYYDPNKNNEVNSPLPTAPPESTHEIIPTIVPNETQIDSEYIFPSDKEYITENYLSTQTKEIVALMRNEIYARHGYIFKTEEYINYFSSKPWYQSNPNFNDSMLSEIEKTNRDTISAYEQKMGWR